MDPTAFLDLLRTRWRTVTACVLLGLVVGTIVSTLTPARFESSAQVYLGTPGWNAITSGDVAEASPYRADQYAQERARTYANLVSGVGFARRVLDKTHSKVDPNQLAAATTGRVLPDTVLIDVSVKAAKSSDAQLLTNAATAELVDEIRRLEMPGGSLISTVEPVITDPADPPHDLADPDVTFNLVLGAAFGFLLGISLAVLTQRKPNSPQHFAAAQRRSDS